ncbi:hypothetical protein [Fictibacillus sp. BK138]|uniref:hypothetical protein n=1 Tax=Fictibacillus sp. BK138 TaxID=2512121 RepID=UPI001029867C|nr:hypothetical protein [Fictibacillus sp. BK138]RZT21393.1 hypothetical protein EV282_0455 [Fictibacillus sp. BK138]
MDMILGISSGVLTILYLWIIGLLRSKVKLNENYTFETRKLAVSLKILMISVTVLLLIKGEFGLLRAFVMAGIVYSIAMVVLVIVLLLLKQWNIQIYRKTMRFLENKKEWL